MDILRILGLRYRVKLGVLPEELVLGGEVRIDITMFGDFSTAGRTDDIHDAIDYRKVVTTVTGEIAAKSYHLVEALAERLAARLLTTIDRVAEIEITVRKIQPPLPVIMDAVEVTIHRKRS